MIDKTGKICLSFLSLLFIFSWCSQYVPYNGERIFVHQKVKESRWWCHPGQGSVQQQMKLLQHPWLWPHLLKMGTTDGFLRTSTNPHIQYYRGRGSRGSRYISESSVNYKKSAMDYQNIIPFLAFWTVKFERSPGADWCPLPISLLPFDCYFSVTFIAVNFCSWATELIHLRLLQCLPLQHPHPLSPL